MAKKRKAKRPTKQDLPAELMEVTSVQMTSFHAENVLRIKAFRMDMDKLGKVVTIEGDNEAGKSSALKSIEMAIAGAGVIPADPIHGDHGEGKVIARFDIERPVDPDDPSKGVETFGQLVATREFKRGKAPKLVVRIHGQKRALASPQTIMEVLLDPIALDPLQFQKMPDEQKQQILAEMTGLDLAAINTKRQQVFDERREVNRDVKRLEAEYEATTFHKDAPKAEVVVADLVKELDRRREHNESGGQLDSDLANISSRLVGMRSALEEMKAKITVSEKEIADAEEAEVNTIQKLAEFTPMDEQTIRAQITDADAINAKVRDNAKHAKSKADFDAAKAEADAFTSQIEQLDADKQQMLVDAESRLPVTGLGFNEDGVVTYKGKPFSQAGKSATAVVSCGVSMKLNEDKMLKILLIDDAEKMDGKTKRKVAEMGADKGFLIVQAQVMPDAGPSEGAVIIEDGEVVE
jgi:hypothetical protein